MENGALEIAHLEMPVFKQNVFYQNLCMIISTSLKCIIESMLFLPPFLPLAWSLGGCLSIMGKYKTKHLLCFIRLPLKYVIVSQSNDNCLQIWHLFAFLELQDKSFNLSRNSSFLIGWTTTTKINFQKWAVLAG